MEKTVRFFFLIKFNFTKFDFYFIIGDILWQQDFGKPIVGLYILENDGLHRLSHTIIGKETLDNLIEDPGNNYSHWVSGSAKRFFYASEWKTL